MGVVDEPPVPQMSSVDAIGEKVELNEVEAVILPA